jgi:hypothetical protein
VSRKDGSRDSKTGTVPVFKTSKNWSINLSATVTIDFQNRTRPVLLILKSRDGNEWILLLYLSILPDILYIGFRWQESSNLSDGGNLFKISALQMVRNHIEFQVRKMD